jgi:hypothetical protein
MAWTQTDIAALEAAIALGARRVKFQTHEVEYQSTGDMLKALDRMKAEVDASARPGILFTEYQGGH